MSMKLFSGLLLILALLTAGCRNEAGSPWAPLFEETDFHYLEETTDKALASLQEGFQAETPDQRSQALDEARQQLLALRNYYNPLTEVRQLLFDADRLVFNARLPQAKSRLQQVRKLLMETADTDHGGVRTALLEVTAMNDELLHQLDLDQQPVKAGFDALIHKINLLLTRGDLVLAGARFNP